MHYSWLTEKAALGAAGPKGQGVFAVARIQRGELVTAFGGHVMTSREFETLPIDQQHHSLQIAEDLFLACPVTTEPADCFNHSCDPNLGLVGSIMLAALRDIGPGEELTFDYATCDADDYDEFECRCGTEGCRRKVTGNDWMIPELQVRYHGHFSVYLERRIAELRAEPPGERLL